ncbi:signal peptidase II [Jeongeupia chitinilytica]|uniref:Lipoprotein signal peptidase n=1 Tax=Jeongeupia chitinilytica TaxID=1041641 RepID=A0ABQ3GY18_9NEIS|nr:signal peptidase II [Jeongeupia chitinilytica]GHD60681.1 lipoprotein signal peptidase [Jeongeupia chitinilytica]
MPKRFWQWIALAVAVIALDQVTKHAIEAAFAYGDVLPVIPGFFNLTLAYNPGAAFSFLADAGGWQRHFFTILALGVSVFIVLTLRKHHGQTLFALSLSLIMGGAIGNVIDRVLFGHVIDFIQVYYRNWYYPAFNLADSAICAGAALMVWDSFRKKESA